MAKTNEMKKILLALVAVAGLSLSSCGQQPAASGAVSSVGTAAFKKALATEPSAQIVDVRTPEEFAQGHLKGAVNIDFYSPTFEKDLAQLKKDQPVMVYCRSGGRSGKAATKMGEMGFSKVVDLSGGILGWQSAGEPVEQ
jgi:rhodanese-related sulfurtransferase